MLLNEVFKLDEMSDKASKPVELFFGRMQPIHIGHARIIKQMHNPVVAIVKGKGTSQDRSRNPLTFAQQKKLLLKVFPRLDVIEVPTGYLPEIVNILRQQDKEVTKVYAGADRINGYRGQINSANKKLDPDKQIDVKFVQTPRATSASEVRAAIRSGDEKKFKSLVPREIWKDFKSLQSIITEGITMDDVKFMSFEEFLEEEKANTTDGVEGSDKPMPSKKKKDDSDDDSKDKSDDKKDDSDDDSDDK